MEIKSDFLIIGSGIAGLSLAIKAARLGSVSIVTKKEKSESNTNYAQGGIAAVMDKTDSFEEHIKDTLTCGAGLCHRDVVEFVVREAPERIQELIEWGVNFTRSEESPDLFDLGQEGGHHRRRVLHAQDLTGREIERALHERVAALKNVNI
nr:FAD-binding protein [Smithellaceae bacterium]